MNVGSIDIKEKPKGINNHPRSYAFNSAADEVWKTVEDLSALGGCVESPFAHKSVAVNTLRSFVFRPESLRRRQQWCEKENYLERMTISHVPMPLTLLLMKFG